MNDKQYEKYLEKLDLKRKTVIDEIEKQCRGSSESVLPALFFVDFEELSPRNILNLDCFIEMYRIGRGVRD